MLAAQQARERSLGGKEPELNAPLRETRQQTSVERWLAALQEREAQQRSGLSLEEQRRAGREQWWSMRRQELQREQEQALKPPTEKTLEPGYAAEPPMTQEERRQKAVERWLEYKRSHSLESGQRSGGASGQGHERSEEKTPERARELTRKRDGYDFEM